jgi:hypothetical protein
MATPIKVTFENHHTHSHVQSELPDDTLIELGKLVVQAFQFSNPVLLTAVRNSNLCSALAATGKVGGLEITVSKRGEPVPEFTVPLTPKAMNSLKTWQIQTGKAP